MELPGSLSLSDEPVPSHFNSVGTLIPCSLKFLFNNILPSDLPVRILPKILYSFFRLRVCYMSAYLILHFVILIIFYVACKLLNPSL
jgi:hypothetical protein